MVIRVGMIDNDCPGAPVRAGEPSLLVRRRIKAGEMGGPRVLSIMDVGGRNYGLSAGDGEAGSRALADEGLIYAVPGCGTFVRT